MVIEVEDGFIFLIDKEIRWTSFDVVAKIRNTMRHKKVGHTGTLDPLATGLVMVCSGKATKMIEGLMSTDKEYTGTFFLGATTPSYDLETEPNAHFPTEHISEQMILDAAKSFLGPQEQIPPMFSAIKVDGKKLYDLARKGQEIELKTRPVEIFEFEITRIALPEVDFRVVVSKGTYIRSLAFDFGKSLQSGGYLAGLRRTRSGNYHTKDAFTIPQWMEWWKTHKAETESLNHDSKTGSD